MPITASNLVFIAAERMTDSLSTDPAVGGGGRMGSAILQTGVENNLFPDVMPGDRTSGAIQYRKCFPAVLSDDNDAASNARVGLAARPAASGVHAALVQVAGGARLAADVRQAIRNGVYSGPGRVSLGFFAAASLPGGDTGQGFAVPAGLVGTLQVGDALAVDLQARRSDGVPGSGGFFSGFVPGSQFAHITAVYTSPDRISVDLGGSFVGATTVVGGISVTAHYEVFRVVRNPGASVSMLATTTASASGNTVQLDTTLARLEQAGSGFLEARNGRAPAFFPGDTILIDNGATPAPTRERALVTRVNYINHTLTLAANLSTTYASGSRVCADMACGTLRGAIVTGPFSQSAWNNVWANLPAGTPPAPLYGGPIPLTNEGAVTDRYALEFTSGTQFRLISERFGTLAQGNVATDFQPLNPLTNQPLFTLLATGWSGSRIPGNVLRFDTTAAAAEAWTVRVVEPGAAAGSDSVRLYLTVDVNT